MNSASYHIIEKVYVEVRTVDENSAFQIKSLIGTFLSNEILPELEILLNNLGVNGQVFRLDKLEIDCSSKSVIDLSSLKKELIQAIEVKLRESLSNPVDSSFLTNEIDGLRSDTEKETSRAVKNSKNLHTTFCFFLEKAYLPWYGKQEYIEELLISENWKRSLSDKSFVDKLSNLFIENQNALHRFILQCSNEHIYAFIKTLGNIGGINRQKLMAFPADLSEESRLIFWEMLMRIALPVKYEVEMFRHFVVSRLKEEKLESEGKETFQKLIERMESDLLIIFKPKTVSKYFKLSKKDIEKIIQSRKKGGDYLKSMGQDLSHTEYGNAKFDFVDENLSDGKNDSAKHSFLKDNESVFVKNAGLILMHPFLKTLFANFNWLNEKGHLKAENKNIAVQTLHYCATGNEQFFEGNMLLEKFLCNIPLEIAIPAKSLLTKTIINEANEMMGQLILHWPELKNTSPQGLRQMFVQRDGKLIRKDNSYQLTVERKAQDVLLDKLQWNISIVKLPWIKELLFVEW